MLLELHGNALIREKTAAYLDQRGRALETLIVALGSGADPGSPEFERLVTLGDGADKEREGTLLWA